MLRQCWHYSPWLADDVRVTPRLPSSQRWPSVETATLQPRCPQIAEAAEVSSRHKVQDQALAIRFATAPDPVPGICWEIRQLPGSPPRIGLATGAPGRASPPRQGRLEAGPAALAAAASSAMNHQEVHPACPSGCPAALLSAESAQSSGPVAGPARRRWPGRRASASRRHAPPRRRRRQNPAATWRGSRPGGLAAPNSPRMWPSERQAWIGCSDVPGLRVRSQSPGISPHHRTSHPAVSGPWLPSSPVHGPQRAAGCRAHPLPPSA
mmetsp:Transcript_26849/g.60634  ORF Transcript_26849/g.60634 Transcript_26849/m.60634 type:complete len:266 (-) Transcript_26849:214-1011(-)